MNAYEAAIRRPMVSGGALTCTTLTDCTLKMPVMQSTGDNTYIVGAMATDRKGNTSARVQTTVVVPGVGISTGQSSVLPADDTLPADGQTQTTITAVLKSEDGQPVTKGTGKVSFFLEGNEDDLAATPDSSHPGTWTATWSNARAQDVKAGLKINGKDAGKRVALTVTPEMTSLAPALFVVTGNVPADGKTPAELRIATADRFGNRVAKQTVTLGVQDATVSLKDATVTSDDQGETRTTLTSTTAGEKTITAALNGQTVTAKVWFLADAASAKVDALTPDVTEKTVTDGLGNPVPDTEVTWSQGAGGDYRLSAEKNTTDSQGHAYPAHGRKVAGTTCLYLFDRNSRGYLSGRRTDNARRSGVGAC
ncbi:TPA: Ig-like domain-containing protein [Salmonella enterica subsp. enterica serovar Anatum]|nr:Ig-like domain-containing protein [Salmonella enterica subsp. enterica serovar Anatum]